MSIYPSKLGGLKNFQIPSEILKQNGTTLSGKALAVMLVLLFKVKDKAERRKFQSGQMVAVGLGQKDLKKYTGLTKNPITKACAELQSAGLIRKVSEDRNDRGEFIASEYSLLHPKTGQVLQYEGSNIWHKLGLNYFLAPTCIVSEHHSRWSLANMRGAEVSVYSAVLWLRNNNWRQTQANAVTTTMLQLRKVAGVQKSTAIKALNDLEEKGLIRFLLSNDGTLYLELCFPTTGEPLPDGPLESEENPLNWHVPNKTRASQPIDLNVPLTLGQFRSLLSVALPADWKTVVFSSGTAKVLCPFHDEDTPSCSLSANPPLFKCFGCDAKGSLYSFLRQVRKLSKKESFQVYAQITGREVRLKDNRKADATYYYRDRLGFLKKRVERFELENGKKEFRQSRPAPGGGWIENLHGVKPLLYNLDRLGPTVVLAEGEKDAETISMCDLKDSNGNRVIGTTSGGADSWIDSFADDLKFCRVILMPDADEPGERYARTVMDSCNKRGIELRIVSFAEDGAKDVTEWLEQGHSVEELAEHIGSDWLQDEEISVEDVHHGI